MTGAIDNAPLRVLDTRPGSGQQGAGQTIGPDAQITFFPGTSTFAPSLTLVPLNATAVVLNITEATETASSYLTVWATGFGQPLASDLNWPAGTGPIANRVIVPYNPLTQSVSIFNWTGSTDVVADLDGYFAPESEFGLGNFEPTGCPIHTADACARTEHAGPGTSGSERGAATSAPSPWTYLQRGHFDHGADSDRDRHRFADCGRVGRHRLPGDFGDRRSAGAHRIGDHHRRGGLPDHQPHPTRRRSSVVIPRVGLLVGPGLVAVRDTSPAASTTA